MRLGFASGRRMATGLLFGKDRICAVVAAPTAREAWRQVRQALKYTRTIELRLDWLKNRNELELLLVRLKLSSVAANFIATCRRREGGGRFGGSVPVQLEYLYAANRAGCKWSDLEAESISDSIIELWRGSNRYGQRLLSLHNFRGKRSQKSLAVLLRKLESLGEKLGFSAFKIATQCKSIGDSLRVLNLAQS